jgi:hypothetical protein
LESELLSVHLFEEANKMVLEAKKKAAEYQEELKKLKSQ